MRNYLSRFAIAVSWGLISFPITYLFATSLIFGIPARNVFTLVVSPFYLGLSLLAIATGINLREAKPSSWYTFIVVNLGVAYLNLVMALQYARAEYWSESFLGMTALQLAIVYQITREIRVPYILPQVRWWESDPRSRIILPARISSTRDVPSFDPIEGDLLDFSLMGCFIRMNQPIEVEERVRVEIEAYGTRAAFSGIVVLKAGAAVTHPRGIGVKFTPQSRELRRIHTALDRRIKRLRNLFATGRYLFSPEEYYKRVSELKHLPLAAEVPIGFRLPLLSSMRRKKALPDLPPGDSRDGD